MKAPAGCSVCFQQTGGGGPYICTLSPVEKTGEKNWHTFLCPALKASKNHQQLLGKPCGLHLSEKLLYSLSSHTSWTLWCSLWYVSQICPIPYPFFPVLSKRSTRAHQISLRCSFPSLQTHQVSTNRLKENNQGKMAKISVMASSKKERVQEVCVLFIKRFHTCQIYSLIFIIGRAETSFPIGNCNKKKEASRITNWLATLQWKLVQTPFLQQFFFFCCSNF